MLVMQLLITSTIAFSTFYIYNNYIYNTRETALDQGSRIEVIRIPLQCYHAHMR